MLGLASCTTAEEEAVELQDYEAVYGEVVKVDKEARTITLSAYDYEQDLEIEVTYNIKEDVKLEGVEDLGEIKKGNWVDLEYYVDEEGNKITDFIAVEIEPIFEEEAIRE